MTSDFEEKSMSDRFNEKYGRLCDEWRQVVRAHAAELLFFDPSEHGESRELILNCLKSSYLKEMQLYELICIAHNLHSLVLCCVHRRLSLLPCVDLSTSPRSAYDEAIDVIRSAVADKTQISGIEFDDLIF
jgi:hypothetical protein